MQTYTVQAPGRRATYPATDAAHARRLAKADGLQVLAVTLASDAPPPPRRSSAPPPPPARTAGRDEDEGSYQAPQRRPARVVTPVERMQIVNAAQARARLCS